jgi:hypothetical protein
VSDYRIDISARRWACQACDVIWDCRFPPACDICHMPMIPATRYRDPTDHKAVWKANQETT